MNELKIRLAKAVLSTWYATSIAGQWTQIDCVHCSNNVYIFKKDWPPKHNLTKIKPLLKRCLLHKDDCVVNEAERIVKGE